MSMLLIQKPEAPQFLRAATEADLVAPVIDHRVEAAAAVALVGAVAAEPAPAAETPVDPLAYEMWLAYMESDPVPRREKPAAPPQERVFNPTFSEHTQTFTHPGVDVRHYNRALYAAWQIQQP